MAADTEDTNLIVAGVNALVDIAQDRNVEAPHRINAAVQLINLARDVAAQAAEAQKPAPNRAARRKA